MENNELLSIKDLEKDDITIDTAIALLTMNSSKIEKQEQIKHIKLIELISRYRKVDSQFEFSTLHELINTKMMTLSNEIIKCNTFLSESRKQLEMSKENDEVSIPLIFTLKNIDDKYDNLTNEANFLTSLKHFNIQDKGIVLDVYLKQMNYVLCNYEITMKNLKILKQDISNFCALQRIKNANNETTSNLDK